jgi:RNA polymerase sigma-70 factor, ECF subfamily
VVEWSAQPDPNAPAVYSWAASPEAGMASRPPRSPIASPDAAAGDSVGLERAHSLTGCDRRGGIVNTMETPHRSSDASMVARLRAGDEAAFVQLVDRHYGSLWRLARMYTTDAVADEVVQETWIAVLHGLEQFEGRSSLRTWIVGIVINIARSRRDREQRQIPFSAFSDPATESEASVDPDRFQKAGDRFPGGWLSFPARWDEQPEQRCLSSEGVAIARRAIDALPGAQREVMSLRDVEGWSSDEVSKVLGISPGNQRVLLHRGRSRVRASLERAMADAAIDKGDRL